jgi:hypothetical protein
MSRWMTLSTLIAAAMFVFAACEAVDENDDATANEGDDTEVVEENDESNLEEEDSETDEDEVSDEVEEPTAEPEPTEAPEPTPEPEPEPTATQEPTEVAEPTEAAEPEAGTRANPIPSGESATIDDWEIRVIGTTPDANQAVADQNQFNDPPVEGNQFFIARIEATYVGEESGDFWIDISLTAVDDGGVVYEGSDSRCGVIPDNITDRGEAFPGATIEGNTCWSVQSEGVNSLLMIAEPIFSWDGDRLFFSLSE